jgi:phospholipid/cholesterol/gamma-HCH transport system substrate-binding protein
MQQPGRASAWLRMFTWRHRPAEQRGAAGGPWRRLAGWWHRIAALPGRRLAAFGAAAVLLAAAVGAGIGYLVSGPPGTQITAYFNEATGMYPGSGVRILGVTVGTVNAVQPDGTQVKVTMTVNHGVSVPASAGAVVILPGVIAGRYIQLVPAYTGGPRMPDNGTIPASRTATPVEIDQIYSDITTLMNNLGPNGVNKNGALSDALNVGAANLQGNGTAFATMIQQFSAAMRTLNGSQGNFFGTIDNLNQFSAMLKNNDSQVREGEQQLSQVFGFLSADRTELGGALQELSVALSQVKGFVQGNRAELKTDLTKLENITRLLVGQRASLAESLGDVPLAADNFLNAYNASNGTLTGRGDLNEISMGPGACTQNPEPAACGGSGSPGSSGSQAGSGQGSSAVPLPLPATGTMSAAPGSSGSLAGGGR